MKFFRARYCGSEVLPVSTAASRIPFARLQVAHFHYVDLCCRSGDAGRTIFATVGECPPSGRIAAGEVKRGVGPMQSIKLPTVLACAAAIVTAAPMARSDGPATGVFGIPQPPNVPR